MPDDVRDQIYEEERQRERRRQTLNTAPSSGILPIQITKVLPSHNSVQAQAETETASKTTMSPVKISGLRDEGVQDYCDWQQSQVRKPSWKAAFQKATDFVVDRCLDLELLHEDQNPQLLVEEGGVPEGIAQRFYRDIKPFAKRRKLDQHADTTQQERPPTEHDSMH